MEDSTYKTAEELKNKISSEETRLYRIEKLLKSAKLECEVEGDFHGNRSIVQKYTSGNSDFIKKLLEDDKRLIMNKLTTLRHEFKQL